MGTRGVFDGEGAVNKYVMNLKNEFEYETVVCTR